MPTTNVGDVAVLTHQAIKQTSARGLSIKDVQEKFEFLNHLFKLVWAFMC